MSLQGVGVAWFAEEDWPTWLALDAGFQPNYQHWLRRVDTTFTRLEDAGVAVVKVEIRPAEFLAWLDSAEGAPHRTLLPTHQRAAYAAMQARRMDYH